MKSSHVLCACMATALCSIVLACGDGATTPCDGGPTEVTETPPLSFEPTHHALVLGRVLDSAGEPVDGMRVMVPLGGCFDSIPAARRVLAEGESVTDSTGAYRLEVETSAPREGSADLYVYARRPGTDDTPRIRDSVLVTIEPVPMTEPPVVTEAPPIRLSIR